VSIPEATEPDSLTVERALALLDAPSNDRELGLDPATGEAVLLRAGRYGPYVQLGELSDPKEKPRTASLLSSMSPETLTLDDALRLLALPREVGVHPDDGAPILAQNGRYGPYLTWGKETRSLESEDQIFTMDLDAALALLAQPKLRGRRATGPLRELGEDPVTKRPVVVRTGRFGPYVTDGETNATLRLGDVIETVSLDRACELLAERRNAEPSTRPRRAAKKSAATSKRPTKKSAAKRAKPAAKKGAKKVAASSPAAKRAAVARGEKANAELLARAQPGDSA
jgi:DNA topoisomerase I